MPRQPRRPASETQDNVANYFESLASATDDGNGIFLGSQLTNAETRVVVSHLNTLTRRFRTMADKSRSIESQEQL